MNLGVFNEREVAAARMYIRIGRIPASGGFTLIELLVVIAIIGILAAIILASLSTAKAKGTDAERISDVKSLETAMELYYDDHHGYPTSAGTSNGDVALSDTVLISDLVPKYIASMPAILVNDGDHYYAGGQTSGVSQRYSLKIQGLSSGACKTGVNVNAGDWGTGLSLCNF